MEFKGCQQITICIPVYCKYRQKKKQKYKKAILSKNARFLGENIVNAHMAKKNIFKKPPKQNASTFIEYLCCLFIKKKTIKMEKIFIHAIGFLY